MTTLTTEEALARVRRGAAVMDEYRPGWRSQINKGTLYLKDKYDCVIGQIMGEYFCNVNGLGLGNWREETGEKNLIYHGFTLPKEERSWLDPLYQPNWKTLTQAWLKVIDEEPTPKPTPIQITQ